MLREIPVGLWSNVFPQDAQLSRLECAVSAG